jgi:hypothetical protein
MCVLVCIRPDVSHAVSVVCPRKVHWQAVKWILRYLWSATDVGSIIDKDNGIGSSVIGYVDLDDTDDLVVTRGDITLKKIVSEENPVNILTKPVLVLKLKRCLDLIIVCNL